MAAGLPVVADNRWGAKDRVNSQTGWLCDYTADYLMAFEEMDPQTLHEKGQAAKERARRYFDPYRWITTIKM
jgi:hypothetical protein